MIHEELSENLGKAAAGLVEFIIALRPYDTYWLTTHCTSGDSERAREIMKRVIPEEFYSDIDRIKPVYWDTSKTEALDWDSDFIWFDNDIAEFEWKILERCNDNQSVIQVDLRNNPNQLKEIVAGIL